VTATRPSPTVRKLRKDLRDIVDAGFACAHAGRLVSRALDVHATLLTRFASVSVVAVGKASAPMAAAFAAAYAGRMQEGIAIGPGERADVPAAFQQWPGSHPVPDARSETAARRALEIARSVRRDDECLVVLLSGGASALMALPAEGFDLSTKARVTTFLLAAGAPIEDLNCVRKHLSAIKGGRLAAAARACVTFAISDVVGPPPDDPSAIGSGPTVADPTTFADALAVVDRAGVGGEFPAAALDVLERGHRGDREETIKPGDPRLARSSYRLIGSRLDAIAGAREAAEARGYTVLTIDEPVVGEARAAGGRLMEGVARWLTEGGRPFCLIAAGETTVRVRGAGKGGRNQELALAAALRGLSDASFAMASVGTDGVDGPTDAAGATVDSTTLDRVRQAGLGDPARYLDANDTYRFFEPLGDLIKTGPTDTNVGDLQVVLVGGDEGTRNEE
jgi:hydroxypyruvate reductase